jgi:hypothetical protein
MPKDGKNLQRLVRTLESVLNNGQKVRIESPKRLPDKITGRLREHDVLLTFSLEHHELIVALECRDRSRPVGVGAVEEFRSKCESTDIHCGIIVSANGFTSTAIKKAAAYNIRCLGLHEVANFDWCLPSHITVRNRVLRGAHLQVLFPVGTDLNGTVVTADGSPVSSDIINSWGVNALTQQSAELPFTVGDHIVNFFETSPNIFMSDGKNVVRADQCTLRANYSVVMTESAFDFRQYLNASKGLDITQAAIAEIPIGDNSADFVLSKDNSGISVAIVPTKVGS